MLIATFGPTTAWVGKQITREGDAFVLEGHGLISAADVMDYDREGLLIWVNEGTRGWVGSRAARSGPRGAADANARTNSPADAAPPADGSSSLRRKDYYERILLIVICALVAINVVLVLIATGVLRVP